MSNTRVKWGDSLNVDTNGIGECEKANQGGVNMMKIFHKHVREKNNETH
jgi:hypothetical protein